MINILIYHINRNVMYILKNEIMIHTDTKTTKPSPMSPQPFPNRQFPQFNFICSTSPREITVKASLDHPASADFLTRLASFLLIY